jgi:hypothetical protein
MTPAISVPLKKEEFEMEDKMSISGPHLTTALICEKILIERDGVPSFIRAAERFTIPVLPPLPPGIPAPQIQPPVLQTNLVVGLKAGDLKAGKYKLTIKMQQPDGSYATERSESVFFNGGEDQGAIAIVPLIMPMPPEGLYWFEVYFETALVTKVPMRILHQQIPVQFPQMR